MEINNSQKKILKIGMYVFLLMIIMPPWRIDQIHPTKGHILSSAPSGYNFIFSPPELKKISSNRYSQINIDVKRLTIQLLGLFGVLLASFVLRSKSPEDMSVRESLTAEEERYWQKKARSMILREKMTKKEQQHISPSLEKSINKFIDETKRRNQNNMAPKSNNLQFGTLVTSGFLEMFNNFNYDPTARHHFELVKTVFYWEDEVPENHRLINVSKNMDGRFYYELLYIFSIRKIICRGKVKANYDFSVSFAEIPEEVRDGLQLRDNEFRSLIQSWNYLCKNCQKWAGFERIRIKVPELFDPEREKQEIELF